MSNDSVGMTLALDISYMLSLDYFLIIAMD